MKKLPLIFIRTPYVKNTNNIVQQMKLLQGLMVTSDPKKLKEIIGVRTVADVYRTLDKMAMNKEYREKLAKHGLSFDYIVGQLKGFIDNAEKDEVRLSALKTLMKSLGVDEYKDAPASGQNWEDMVASVADEPIEGDYEVVEPEIPKHELVRLEGEREIAGSLYGES